MWLSVSRWLMAALLAVLDFYLELTHRWQSTLHSFRPSQEEWTPDFVVVGAGSSGCVVAARLAEKNYSVLLLEAGGPPHWLQALPALFPAFQQSPYDWDYATTTSAGASQPVASQSRLSAGRALGGSGAINAMIYARGHPSDYDAWDEMLGSRSGWSYADLRPLFNRFERGHSGPSASVSHLPHAHRVTSLFVDAAEQSGWRTKDVDVSQSEAGAFSYARFFMKNGRR